MPRDAIDEQTLTRWCRDTCVRNRQSVSIGGHTTFHRVYRRVIVRNMSFLTTLVQGVHTVIGITPPPPEQTARYAVIWAMALLGSAAIIGGFGYFLMGVVFAPR